MTPREKEVIPRWFQGFMLFLCMFGLHCKHTTMQYKRCCWCERRWAK